MLSQGSEAASSPGICSWDRVATIVGRNIYHKVLFIFAFLVFFQPLQSAQGSELLGLRFGPQAEKTRIVFDLVGAPNFDVFGDDTNKGRLFVDFQNMASDSKGLSGFRGKGHIQKYAYFPNGSDGTRFALDFGKTARIEDIFVLEPTGSIKKHRLVIDLRSASVQDYLASLPRIVSPSELANAPVSTQAPVPRPQIEQRKQIETSVATLKTGPAAPNAPRLKPIARLDTVESVENATNSNSTVVSSASRPTSTVEQILLAEEERQKKLNSRIAQARQKQRETRRNSKKKKSNELAKLAVVIDPGHGGSHPGAVGQNGTLEKDVNLEAAKVLAAKLAATGRYRPILTRIDDSKVDLEDRSRIARDVDAKLFISLHADGNDNSTLRGSSVYTLSEGGAKRSFQEAREQENYTLTSEYADGEDLANFTPEVGQILFDVAQTTSKNASEKLASLILPRLGKVVPLVKNAKRTEDLKVLLRPDVPAVLVEMAFISNVKDEKNLNDTLWRDKTMGVVALAIDEYFLNDATLRQARRNSNSQAGVTGGLN